MKPLETNYSGITFRSRAEARWAVFFDKMNWKWDYEDQGYELHSGKRYLPDFKISLPDKAEWYVEVKPDSFDKHEHEEYMKKLQEFSEESGTDLIILDGNPSCKPFDIICCELTFPSLQMGLLQDYDPYILVCDKYWFGQMQFCEETGRASLDFDERRISKAFGKQYAQAIKSAKNEKFGI